MEILRNSLSFEKNAAICFPDNFDNNISIAMNSSSCQLSFNTLIGSPGCTYAFLGRPRNLTKILVKCYSPVKIQETSLE